MGERTIWISAGLLGLAVAVALAVLTSHVSRPPVGISGEPVSAGRQLAPARAATRAATATTAPARPRAQRPASRTATTAAPPPPAARVPPAAENSDDGTSDSSGSGSGDDSSGKGRGRGRGRGGDDD